VVEMARSAGGGFAGAKRVVSGRSPLNFRGHWQDPRRLDSCVQAGVAEFLTALTRLIDYRARAAGEPHATERGVMAIVFMV